MNILYGVQGTGNGHLSRARAMARALQERGHSVDFLFSGRDPAHYFDMQCFGQFKTRDGLTFVNIDGRVSYRRTVLNNNYARFLKDVLSLEVSSYDLILTDFEPVTAWAGRLRRKQVVSMGHQPAFDFAVPVADRDWRTQLLMRLFAPGNVRVGLHWDNYGAPILPPMVDVGHQTDAGDGAVDERIAALRQSHKVLVYLPFENQERVRAMLLQIPQFEFYVYAPGSESYTERNLHLRSPSVEGFRRDLATSSAVLCNAGFELASECLSLGVRVMVKPLERQMEQASNALALEQLGFAEQTRGLDAAHIERWLESTASPLHIRFPDVAAAISTWLSEGDLSAPSLGVLSSNLWNEVRLI